MAIKLPMFRTTQLEEREKERKKEEGRKEGKYRSVQQMLFVCILISDVVMKACRK